MNRLIRNLLITSLNLIFTDQVTAQTFKALHHFNGTNGATPYAGLLHAGSKIYGTTYFGGASSNGTVFAINIDGTGFSTLHHFTAASGQYPIATNSDGIYPNCSLVLLGDFLYGTAQGGGASARGSVFGIRTDGTGFTNLHSFARTTSGTNFGGSYPRSRLCVVGDSLFGVAEHGGSFGVGTIFKLPLNGSSISVLHNFPKASVSSGTNSDGVNPHAGLTLSGNTLYGTAYGGGSFGGGSVFAVNTSGTDFTNLHSFANAPYYTNTGGAIPFSLLAQSGNALFGTTVYGGSAGNGTVFRLDTDGTGFTNLHVFSPLVSNTNADGAIPHADMVLSGDTLYGIARGGGNSGSGTVFALRTNGTAFKTLHSFTSLNAGTNKDGAAPVGLALSDYTLYGLANSGGNFGKGTVFSLSFAPQLTISRSGTNVVLTWLTNNGGFDYAGFILQSATNLASPIVWTLVSPSPVVVNGENMVTNPVSDVQRLYRLSK